MLSLQKTFTVLLPVEVLDFGARVLEGGHPQPRPWAGEIWVRRGHVATPPHTNTDTTHEETQKEFAKREKNGDEKLTLCWSLADAVEWSVEISEICVPGCHPISHAYYILVFGMWLPTSNIWKTYRQPLLGAQPSARLHPCQYKHVIIIITAALICWTHHTDAVLHVPCGESLFQF